MKKSICIVSLLLFVSAVSFSESLKVHSQYVGLPSALDIEHNMELGYSFETKLLQDSKRSYGYNQKSAQRLRNIGLGFFITSIVGVVLGSSLMLGGLLSAFPKEEYNSIIELLATNPSSKEVKQSIALTYSGLIITSTTSTLFIPGIVMWAVGESRLSRVEL